VPDQQKERLLDSPLSNQIFGYQRLGSSPSGPPEVVFPGASEVCAAHRAAQVRLCVSPRTHLRTAISEEHQACAYLWGTAVHGRVPRSEIPKWCIEVVTERRFSRFTELLGTFVVVVDEPQERRITIVSDVLGIRPLFITKHEGRFVFGSDVWALYEAGVASGEIDYDAVASWLAYRYNCTSGSLFADVRRLPPGRAVVIQDGQLTETTYATFEMGRSAQTGESAADEIHDIVEFTVKTVLAEEPRVTIPLSGGYDSRYLLASCMSARAGFDHVVNVRFTDQEGQVAEAVAYALNVPLETIRVDTSIWDIYEQAHHFMPDGFPITKFVTHCVADRYPDVPIVNGFLGDSLIRGSNDKCAGRYEHECQGDLADILQRRHFAISLNLFRPEVASGIEARSRVPMEEAVKSGRGRVFGWADLYLRQRYYISNNFLQHIGLAEAVLPFYTWPLLSYKMNGAYEVFNKDTYQGIFSRYFPTIAGIPHSSDLNRPKGRARRATTARRWAQRLLGPLFEKGRLNLLRRSTCVPLVIMGASRLTWRSTRIVPIVEDAILTCQRLYLLEERAREARLDLDWGRV
jgi:Glutamine amidotransferase domain